MNAEKELMLFQFDDPRSAGLWRPINDVVMGGASDSRLLTSGAGTAIFFGQVSLANNGGFASLTSAPDQHDLRAYAGIRLVISGDGHRYKLCLKTDAGFDGVLYLAAFPTQRETWETMDIGFDEFAPTFRGRRLNDAPTLDSSHIQTFGFMISNKQAGDFRLEIRSILAYRV